MNIVAFAGSNSKNSINKQLVTFVGSYFKDDVVTILDLNDFEMPIYSADRELENGIPELALNFAKQIDEANLLLISLAEHNGAYSVAFKNIFDWISRIPNRKAFGDKPIFLMATSPGPRGGATVLEIASGRIPYSGGQIIDTFSLPSFYDNFNNGITNEALKNALEEKIAGIKIQF